MKRKVRDSCGNTSPRETPQAQKRRGGSRTARGKRVPAVEINVTISQKKMNYFLSVFLQNRARLRRFF
ncbi:hypothetical protein QNH26_20805 [Peribacillus frigoritolerans]|uniref:hypothetical protein n=1 Tax=Peribacillus frigoritolerans TaxID=450367 RepID=UPI0024C12C12|nr:hypothetical protein [Peribacillus frigoritolerans]WHX66079.1 hypothetical protein QNH26_20805 [Peribacillus frigoritolerans]